MHKWKRAMLLAGALLLLDGGPRSAADDFESTWYTVDNGGEMWTTGGNFELSGTIAQPEAGVVTGGDYELTGGFWALLSGGLVFLPGDLNCDGVVNFADINPFVLALTGQGAYEAAFPNCTWLNADCNSDGNVNFADINPFVALLSGS